MMEKPIVTVGVFTYNSSKYVIETLESIKAQTYHPLKLIIGDDCSTDNTVELCLKWIEDNKSRFISTRIIVPEHNTGVSGNCNRVEDACDTEWYKGIAGDDLLKPDCISDNIEYVQLHPDVVFVFSKIEAFGADNQQCINFNNSIDWSFFDLPQDEQRRLLYISNHLTAPSLFQNLIKARNLGIRNDERIPMMEDYPKWINAIEKGIHFHFFDKVTIGYRISNQSLSISANPSLKYLESLRLFYYYYKFSKVYERNKDEAIKDAVESELEYIQSLIDSKSDFQILKNSITYKVGKVILAPIAWLRKQIMF